MGSVLKRRRLPVPRSPEEAATWLADIAAAQRALDTIKSRLNKRVDDLKAVASEEAAPHEDRIADLVEGLYRYGTDHRDELTNNGRRKSIKLPTGIYGWKLSKPRLEVQDQSSVVSWLERRELEEYLKRSVELRRHELLKAPDLVKQLDGVAIVQEEEFFVKPAEIEVELIQGKLKKSIAE